MANTFGQSKANEDSTWMNNKELNPQENSSVTNDSIEESDNQGDTTWRPTDDKLESPTSSAFDDSEAKKRDRNIETDSPGINPGAGK
ncbi:MAG TPA: hypothetical protein VGD31_16805 [Sphingobacteriaceae bacterium]